MNYNLKNTFKAVLSLLATLLLCFQLSSQVLVKGSGIRYYQGYTIATYPTATAPVTSVGTEFSYFIDLNIVCKWDRVNSRWVPVDNILAQSGVPTHTPATGDPLTYLDKVTGSFYKYNAGLPGWEIFDGTPEVVSRITNVRDTTSLTPKTGDEFINAAMDTSGVYSTDRWLLRIGGSGTGQGFTVLDTTFTGNYVASTDKLINNLTAIPESNDIVVTLPNPSSSTVNIIYNVTQINRNNTGLGFTLAQVDGIDYDFFNNGDTTQFVAFNYGIGESYRFTTAQINGAYRWVATRVSTDENFELPTVSELKTTNYPIGAKVTVLNTTEANELNYHIGSSIPSNLIVDSFAVAPTLGSKYAVLKENKVLRPEMFGAKADLLRSSVSYTENSKTITCATCSFTSSDVGKVVAIKRARIDTAYSMKRVSMNAYIQSVSNGTTIVIDSFIDITGADEMIWGTNNWVAFQQMYEYANTYNIRNIVIGEGSYYVNALGVNLKSFAGIDGMIQRGAINITGSGATRSILKYGPEDVQRINENSIVNYRAIYMVGDGHRELSDFTIESPDRVSTGTAPGHTRGIYSEARVNSDISLTLNSVNIKPGGNIEDGFSHAIEQSLGGTWDVGADSVINMVRFELNNCVIGAGSQVITFFSQDGPCKELIVNDCELDGGGILNTATYLGVASMASGSNILTINVDTFSFYDIRSQYATDRLPLVKLSGTTDFITASITNRNTAVMTTNAGSTFSNVDFTWTANNDNVEGHGMYLHPNVSVDIKDLNHTNIRGNAINYFTGSGQPGRTRIFRLDNYRATTPTGSIANLGLVGTNMNLGSVADGSYFEFLNSDLEITFTGGVYSSTRFYNCIFNDLVLGDTSYIENSFGDVKFTGSGDKYEIVGGVHPQIDCEDKTGTYYVTNARGGELILDGATYFFYNGGSLSSVKIPTTATDLTEGVISNTVLDADIGQQTYFFIGTTNDIDVLKQRLLFKNISISGKAVANWSTTAPKGLLEVKQGVNNTPISSRTSIAQPGAFTINTDYQNLRYAVLPYDYDFHTISIANDSVSQIEISENGNTSIYDFYNESTRVFQGRITIDPIGENFKFITGGNLRLKHRGTRTELSSFIRDVTNQVWIETSNTRKTTTTTPLRAGINGEIVYNSDISADTIQWQYQISTTDVSAELESLTGATLPFEFDLSNVPYLGFEESYYVDPATLLTITVPLTSGGNETFTVGNYGELTGSNGGTGNIRLSDGHVIINTLGTSTLNTASNVSTAYSYVSSTEWAAYGVSDLSIVAETAVGATAVVGTELPVNSTGGAVVVNPPASPTAGQIFAVFDSRSQAAVNNITVDFITAGVNLNGVAANYVLSTTRGYVEFKYINATTGWRQKD